MPDSPTGATLAEIIAGVPLFSELPEQTLVGLARSLRERVLGAGALLFAEGDSGHELFIIVEGQILVSRSVGTPDERLLGDRGPGEFIGELSLLGVDSRRSATALASIPSRLLQMGRDELHDLLRRHPTLATSMLRLMGERLTAAHTGAIRDLHERNERLSQAYAELQAAQEQLIDKERMERELQVAYEIQMSILPRTMPALAGFRFGARILPARSVGGDFFDFIPLGDGLVGVAIGDVTDKGVPAAIFMAQARALLRAEAHRATTPREALEQVNSHLLQMNDAGLFVTMIYGVLEARSGRFSYARAGHELPLIAPAAGAVVRAAHVQGMALGIVERPPIDEQSLTLAPGDTLLLYTDGATEAHNPEYEEFGIVRLGAALSTYRDEPADALCARLLGLVVDFQSPAPQHDDITLVVVECLAAG